MSGVLSLEWKLHLRAAMPSRVWLVAACLALTACMPPPTNVVDDEKELLGALATAEYRGWGWIQMNTTPFQSTLDPTAHVTMYVSTDAAPAYEGVTPDHPGTIGPEFPVGGTVVREASDASGAVTLLTVMVKRERGYFPAVGDFFFGVADPSGMPVTSDHTMKWGKLDECATCHEGRAGAGFLFGVANANRTH